MIKQRIFDKQGNLKGMFYADKYQQTISKWIGVLLPLPIIIGIGFAIKHPIDKMDKQFCINTAKDRSLKWIKRMDKYNGWNEVPKSIHHDLYDFLYRCEKYYKVDHKSIMFPNWVYDFILIYEQEYSSNISLNYNLYMDDILDEYSYL